MAGDVGERLARDEVGGALGVRGPAALGDRGAHRDREVLGHRLECRPEASLGQDGGVDAARETAQLFECDVELAAYAGDSLGRLGVGARPDRAQLHRRAEDPLLRAVVQVALEPSSLGEPRRRAAGPASA